MVVKRTQMILHLADDIILGYVEAALMILENRSADISPYGCYMGRYIANDFTVIN
ncbi:MAG: hypothetical protein PHY47_21900 [Lachnospiraceae bacterium]|nr:hypothetical protein [Lachnospiraceae bacterium]